MVRKKLMLAVGVLIGFTLPAHSNADVEVVTTRGICTVFGFAGKSSQCSKLVSVHTVHSRRTNFTIAGSNLVIGFAGSQDMRLASDRYLLLIDTLVVKGKIHRARGQCMARLSGADGRISALTCRATFLGGDVRAAFKAIGPPIAEQL